MTEQAFDKNQESAENTDNLSQEELSEMEEALAAGLNADENISGSQHLAEQLSDEAIEKLTTERDEYKDKYLRLVAEFDNFRKRNAKEKEELRQTAGKDIITSFLDVMDDMERAARQIETSEDIVQVKEGVSLVFNKFRHTLQQKGVKKMEAAQQEFDPELHEAITEIPAPSEDMKGKVIDVVQPGYYLNDKLIRHAKVVVGN